MLEIEPFLYISLLIVISFGSYLFTSSFFKKLVSLSLLTFFTMAIVDLKLLETTNIETGLNVIVYLIPILILVLIFFKKTITKFGN